MKKTIEYIKNNKIISVLNFAILIILFVPFSKTGFVEFEDSDYKWRNNYIINNFDLIIFYTIITAPIIWFQFIKNTTGRKILIILSCIICTLNAPLSMIGGQDYVPSWGQLITISFAPLTFFILMIEFRKNK